MALLYWPEPEFMNRVLTTSTGEATTVVQKPALKAAVKWQGRLSDGRPNDITHSGGFFHSPVGPSFTDGIFPCTLPVIRSYFRMSSLMMS